MTVNQRQQNVSCSSGEILYRKTKCCYSLDSKAFVIGFQDHNPLVVATDTKLYDLLAVNKNSGCNTPETQGFTILEYRITLNL